MTQFNVHQQIIIHQLKVGAVNNSSILQIGASGNVRALSNLYNTGGFTGAAPELGQSASAYEGSTLPLVPLPSPSV